MKKHLSFALATALIAMAIVPGATFAATSSTPTVAVTTDDTLTITISGDITPNITGQVTETANTTGEYLPVSADVITVVDKKDDAVGHKITWDFLTGTFTYAGSDSDGGVNYGSLTLTSGFTPGSNQVSFSISSGYGSASQVAFSKTNSNCANDGGYTRTARYGIKAAETAKFAESANSCSGTAVYGMPRLGLIGPSNGLGGGAYTSAAVLVIYDGTT